MKKTDNDLFKEITDKRLLLHCCCGPCSTTCVKRLINENYEVVLWFSNDNIHPFDEFQKRYNNLLKVAENYNLKVLIDNYDHEAWLKAISGYEEEREGGSRCGLCFNYNLVKAELKAKELNIPYFTTTLSVSRYKNSKRIFKIGESLEGFLPMNFKKMGGYEESIKLSKEIDLYRQKYCGCEFSLKESLDFQDKLKKKND